MDAQAKHITAGYQMVDSIEINNFRSFREIKAGGFRRINLLVGDNGSGKTALLEALFLAAGVSPELVLRTRGWRGAGFEAGKVMLSQEDRDKTIWADLFHKFQTTKPAFIALKGEKEENRTVTIQFHERGRVKLTPPGRGKDGPPRATPQPASFEFKWKIQGFPDVTVAPVFQGDKFVFPPVRDAYVKAAFFAANQTTSSLESASRFSRLSCAFKVEEFTKKFSDIYSNIDDLSLEVALTSPMIFARVKSIPAKIPMSLASGGMNKLVAILLAITDQVGGLILIDEIENGFYHKSLPLVWNAILKFATDYHCQVFASTHSLECLTAAATVAKSRPEDFAVLRTVLKNGETMLRRFDGDKFAEAMDENIEIR